MNATTYSTQRGIVFQTDLLDVVLDDAVETYAAVDSITSAMTDAIVRHVARVENSELVDAQLETATAVSDSGLASGDSTITQVGETQDGYAVCQDGVSHGTTTTDEKAGYIGAAAETGAMAKRDSSLRVATGGNDRIGSDYAVVRDADFIGNGLATEERIKGERAELERYTEFYTRLKEDFDLGRADTTSDMDGREYALSRDAERVTTTQDAIRAMDWDAIRTTYPEWFDGHQGWVRTSDDQETVTVPSTPQDTAPTRKVQLEFGSQQVREREQMSIGGRTVSVPTDIERARVPVFEDLRNTVAGERRALVAEYPEARELAERITEKWSSERGVPEGFFAPIAETAGHIAELLAETTLNEFEAAPAGARRAFDEHWGVQALSDFSPKWSSASVIAKVGEMSSDMNGAYFQRAWLEPLCPNRDFWYFEDRVRFSAFWSYEAWGEQRVTPSRSIQAGNKKPWQDSSDAAGNGDVYGLATEIREGDIVLIENAKPSAYGSNGMQFKSLAAHSDTQITVIHRRNDQRADVTSWPAEDAARRRRARGRSRTRGLMSGEYEPVERPESPGSLVDAQIEAVRDVGGDAYLSATLEAGSDDGAVARAVQAANSAFWEHRAARAEWLTEKQGIPTQLLHSPVEHDIDITVYDGRDASKDGVPIREFLAREANADVEGRDVVAEDSERAAAWSAADLEALEETTVAPSQSDE